MDNFISGRERSHCLPDARADGIYHQEFGFGTVTLVSGNGPGNVIAGVHADEFDFHSLHSAPGIQFLEVVFNPHVGRDIQAGNGPGVIRQAQVGNRFFLGPRIAVRRTEQKGKNQNSKKEPSSCLSHNALLSLKLKGRKGDS